MLSCPLHPTITPEFPPAVPALHWPHQTRYRQAAQALAQELFEALDEDLKPYVLLLALPVDDTQPPPAAWSRPIATLPAEAFSDAMFQGPGAFSTPPPGPTRSATG